MWKRSYSYESYSLAEDYPLIERLDEFFKYSEMNLISPDPFFSPYFGAYSLLAIGWSWIRDRTLPADLTAEVTQLTPGTSPYDKYRYLWN